MALLEYKAPALDSLETDRLISDLSDPTQDTAELFRSNLNWSARIVLAADTSQVNYSSLSGKAMEVIADAGVYLRENASPLIALPAEMTGRENQPLFVDPYPKILWNSGLIIPSIPGDSKKSTIKEKVYNSLRLIEVADALWYMVNKRGLLVSLQKTIEFHRKIQRFAILGYPFYRYTVLRFQKDWNAFVRYSYENSQSVGQVIDEDNKVGPDTIEAYNTALAMSGGGSQGTAQRWQDTVSAASGYKT